MSKNEVSEEVAEFVREGILSRLRDGDNDVSLADALRVTKVTVGSIRKGERNVGLKVAMGYARLLKIEFSELEERAREAAKKRPRVVPDDLYPARTAALAPFRSIDDPLIRRVVEEIATAQFSGAATYDVVRWSEKITRAIREAQLDEQQPARVTERKGASDEAVAEHLANRARNPMPAKPRR